MHLAFRLAFFRLLLVSTCLEQALSLVEGVGAGQNAAESAGLAASWPWSRVSINGPSPAAREGHSLVEVGKRLFLFGGCVQGIRCFNDVHIFDTETLTWSQEPITGDAPEPRGGHSATLVGTDMYVFGGANSDTTYGDAYKLDLIQRHWSRAVPVGSTSLPSRRTSHAAAADSHGRIYIAGGYDAESNFLNDVWILDVYAGQSQDWKDGNSFPAVWEKPSPTGEAPTPREGHSLTLVDRHLVLFGGYTASGAVSNDVYLYDLETQAWKSARPAGTEVPAPRQAHSAVRHGRDVVVTDQIASHVDHSQLSMCGSECLLQHVHLVKVRALLHKVQGVDLLPNFRKTSERVISDNLR